jgi:sulfur-oxidizing protein SoxX
VLGLLASHSSRGADAAALVAYRIDGDGIEAPLTGRAGDPARGREIVVTRHVGTCLLCHSGPFPEERFQGTIGPDLHGVGARLSAAQLRLRVVNPAHLNPDTVMPSYYVVTGLNRVGKPWRDKPVLTAEQVEDVVAFLQTLRDQ